MLKLIPPGQRKGNRYYLVRGRYQGVDIETSTETINKADAERFKNELERQILNAAIPGPSDRITFHRAIDLYQASKELHANDISALLRLKSAIADKPLSAIVQADIDTAALALHPDASNEWRNRSVYTPAIAVMNYAALNRWTPFQKWKRPAMKKPDTRAASDASATALLDATTGFENLLLLWLFKHGTRISDALSVQRERINLDSLTYDVYVSKSKSWRTMHLDSSVALTLPPILKQQSTGPLFPWRTRWKVYQWLVPLRDTLQIQFTPHMARHWLGKQLDKAGAGQRAIGNALGQSSVRSTARYVSSDLETVRTLTESIKLGKGKK